MRWPAKLGIGVLAVIALVVLAYVILFPVHNWRLKHRIWVAFGVQANALEVVDLPVAEREGGRIFSVPALETAAEHRFPQGTLASDVSNSLAGVFGPESIHIYEPAPGDRRLSCRFDSEQGLGYRDAMWLEFALDSSNRIQTIKAGWWGIAL